jgi:peptidoglycan/LPS O-acetylase OafA/YrhL
MNTLGVIVLFVHILGIAALLGGLLAQARTPEKRITPIIRDGVGLAFLAGIVLVGVLEAGDGDPNHLKLGVKFLVTLVILVLVMANMRKPHIPQGLYWALTGLTIPQRCAGALLEWWPHLLTARPSVVALEGK